MYTAEAWVNKGVTMKRIEFKGRAKHGIRAHNFSKMKVVLREGKSQEEKDRAARERKLRKIISAGITREDIPIRNPAPGWSW
jgi:large subunit ribosomal protein L22